MRSYNISPWLKAYIFMHALVTAKLKKLFFNGPATKALPLSLTLELSGHIYFRNSFFELQKRFFHGMVLQNTLRSDVSAILKSINVREIVREFGVVKQ